MNLIASCIVRGSLARLEIVPNVAGVLMSLFGMPKFTVLNTLKMSQPQRRRQARAELDLALHRQVEVLEAGTVSRLRSSLPNDARRHRLRTPRC